MIRYLLENQAIALHTTFVSNGFLGLLFVVIIGLALGEDYLARRWTPAYFRSGLRLLTRRYLITGRVPLTHRLQQAMIDAQTATTYHVIDRETCFFRYKPTGFFHRETWRLHGYIHYLPTENAIQVVGFTDWSTVIVFVVLLIWLPGAQILTAFQADAWQQWMYLATLAVAILWWFRQRRLCDRIGRSLAEGN